MMPSENPSAFSLEKVTTGVAELDALLGGGLDRGTSNLFVGPSGAGKSTLSGQFASASAARGEKVAFFLFDESLHTFLHRSDSLGIGLRAHHESGMVRARHVDAAALSPGEMGHYIRNFVEVDGVRVVVIDSLNGYMQAMPEEKFLILQLHELLSYLNQKGVISILLMAQHGLVGDMDTPADLTYLADTVVVMRYFEVRGSIRKAISVVKKRSGSHEDSIREFSTKAGRITVGPVLEDFQGILRGIPSFEPGDAG